MASFSGEEKRRDGRGPPVLHWWFCHVRLLLHHVAGLQNEVDVAFAIHEHRLSEIDPSQGKCTLLALSGDAAKLAILHPVSACQKSSPTFQGDDRHLRASLIRRCKLRSRLRPLNVTGGLHRWGLVESGLARGGVIAAGSGPGGLGDKVAGHREWDLYIVHQAERDSGFAFDCGIGSACGQSDDLDRPQDRNHPSQGVALGMAFAVNVSLRVDLQVGGGDNLCPERQDFAGNDQAVKFQSDPALANEVAGILVILEMAAEHGAAGKCGMPEGVDNSKMAKDGIADHGGFGGEVGFIEGALQKRTRRDDVVRSRGGLRKDTAENAEGEGDKKVFRGMAILLVD